MPHRFGADFGCPTLPTKSTNKSLYDLTVVTRNVADFGGGRFGLRVLNPFTP